MNYLSDVDDSTDGARFGLALREQVDGATIDLDALVRTSAQRGTRIRRTRWAAAGTGIVAVAAAAGIGFVVVGNTGTTMVDGSTSFADSPSASASATSSVDAPPLTGEVMDVTLPSGATATFVPMNSWSEVIDSSSIAILRTVVDGDTLTAMGSYLIKSTDATPSDFDWLRENYATAGTAWTALGETPNVATVEVSPDN